LQSSYDVRVWSTRRYQGERKTTYYVRCSVAGAARQKPFQGEALADSFRSDLVVAARKSEAFDVDSGLPVSVLRTRRDDPPPVQHCPPRGPHRPTEISAALRWIETHTRPVSALADAEVLRALLDHLTVTLDGATAAPSVTVNAETQVSCPPTI
jgi:hypothetical protein